MSIFELSTSNFKDRILWGKINGPQYGYVEITDFCNRCCSYCQIAKPNQQTMSLDLFKRIVEEFVSVGMFEIRLGGGEPMLCKEIEKMVDIAHQSGLSVWICSNGVNLDIHECNRLKSFGLTGLRISLDSIVPKENDLYRGKNSWRDAVQAINSALCVGIQVLINATISDHNISSFEKLIKYGDMMGISVVPHFVMPVGKGKEHFIRHQQNDEVNARHNETIFQQKSRMTCSAVSEMIAVSPEGLVRPCIFGGPVKDITKFSLHEILVSEEFSRYKGANEKSNACAKCNIRAKFGSKMSCPLETVCKGGCRLFDEEGFTD